MLLLVALAAPLFLWAAPALRIVTLAPSLTELVYAAGAGEKLVGVSAASDFPVAAKRLPVVADYSGVNLESLLAMKPDLVLAWPNGTKSQDIARLRSLNIRVEEVGISGLADVALAIRRIGGLTQSATVAEAAAVDVERRVNALHQVYAKRARVPTFIEIAHSPLMTANRAHFVSGVVTLCGGENVFADVAQLVFEPSRERLLQLDPAVVIYGGRVPSASKRDTSAYVGTRAASTQRIVAINPDHLLRPGPRLVDAAEAVCAALEQVRAQK